MSVQDLRTYIHDMVILCQNVVHNRICNILKIYELPHDKTNKMMCAQQRLRSAWTSIQSDQSSLCSQWAAKGPRFLYADSEDSDQTGWMPTLIWVFAGHTDDFAFVVIWFLYIYIYIYIYKKKEPLGDSCWHVCQETRLRPSESQETCFI